MRKEQECFVSCIAEADMPTQAGQFRIKIFVDSISNNEHVVLLKGDINPLQPILIRMHSECFTGDLLGSIRCDCREQLHRAMKKIAKHGGVLLYLRQEGRGIGLGNKIKAYALQDQGLDTVEANVSLGFHPDLRDYGVGAQILRELGIQRMKLMTNNPRKIAELEAHGLEVVERVPLQISACKVNRNYLQTKKEKLGHILTEQIFKPEERCA